MTQCICGALLPLHPGGGRQKHYCSDRCRQQAKRDRDRQGETVKRDSLMQGIVCGDFYEEVKRVKDGSIDLILTDPPYNVSNERTFVLKGRSNICQDFGEWDKYEHQAFIGLFTSWAREWARILRPQGSGYTFVADRYISHLIDALESHGLYVKSTVVWHKTNPGTQIRKINFKSSCEYVVFFAKGESGYTFNWLGENEMHNHTNLPICQGSERLSRGGHTLHPTQKPENLLSHFILISSNPGDIVFDGFAGVGSVGSACKKLGRRFIGMEQDATFFDAMQRRLAQRSFWDELEEVLA
jgi:DNA modification methylase